MSSHITRVCTGSCFSNCRAQQCRNASCLHEKKNKIRVIALLTLGHRSMSLCMLDLEQIPFPSKLSFIRNTVNNSSCKKELPEMLHMNLKVHKLKERQYSLAVLVGTLCHVLTSPKLRFLMILPSPGRGSRGRGHCPSACRAHLDSPPDLPSSKWVVHLLVWLKCLKNHMRSSQELCTFCPTVP